ncbi:CocE/NonD family hydrolase C-terminal non-catalytic domain-containing protein [Actinomycetospora soli]|uniref:CocE/NonD family hydrolase C-terminal non-catalytic domain-containing protein n=1 Tax=Actinomycetospora soli TaxID=2893887 RepID=UPI001E337C38|nr:CocE/NonD family hydrolase C-terminal non-catalytic domain-containing protein [Actinomycetospora soli]MCD2189379.1 hypothetical protein [Actinomycetospora soli]
MTHRLTTQTAPAGSNSWAAVPLGVPLPGGLDELANQTLSFELPVTEDVRFAGAVTARLSFSSTEIDSFVLARLSRIDATGTAHQLSLGAVRPVARAEDTARSTSVEIAIDPGSREPLTPHEPVVLRFSLTPGPVQLRAGEILRLDLASRTDLVRKGPEDGYPQFDLPVPPYLARNTVHLGGESWLDLTAVTVRP